MNDDPYAERNEEHEQDRPELLDHPRLGLPTPADVPSFHYEGVSYAVRLGGEEVARLTRRYPMEQGGDPRPWRIIWARGLSASERFEDFADTWTEALDLIKRRIGEAFRYLAVPPIHSAECVVDPSKCPSYGSSCSEPGYQCPKPLDPST